MLSCGIKFQIKSSGKNGGKAGKEETIFYTKLFIELTGLK